MHRFNSLILALAIALGAATSLSPLAWAAPPAAHGATPTPAPSPCVGSTTARISPSTLLLGESTEVQLAVRAVCPAEYIWLHLVFVVDPSARMGRSTVRELQDFLKWHIAALNLKDNPNTKVGVVVVDETARTVAPLTNDANRARRGVSRIAAEGDTRIDLGIAEGLRILVGARRPGKAINEMLVVFADGYNANGCREAESAARTAYHHGVLVSSVCVGRDCEVECMRELASSRRYFVNWDEATMAVHIWNRIRRDLQHTTIRRMTVVETLPANMTYVVGSAIPEPSEIATDTLRLTWTQNFVPSDGLTITYRVQPQALGHHPTSLGARADFRDNQDRVGAVNFPIPWADVLAPFLAPTPTPPPAP